MDDCVVIDIETSGVNSSTSQITGISAVLLKNGIVDGLKYECWCRCHNLEKAAADIIVKKAAFFEDQIPLAQAINNLNSFLNGHRLVAKSPSFCEDFLHKALVLSLATKAAGGNSASPLEPIRSRSGNKPQ